MWVLRCAWVSAQRLSGKISDVAFPHVAFPLDFGRGGVVQSEIMKIAQLYLVVVGMVGMSAFGERTPWTHRNFQNDPEDFRFAIVPTAGAATTAARSRTRLPA